MLIFKLENKEKQIISCSNNFISNSVSNPNFNLNSQQYIDKIDSIKKEQHKGQNILLTDLLNNLVKNSFPKNGLPGSQQNRIISETAEFLKLFFSILY